MRSQLDAVDHRLPGTGVFDIKTRAALPIRMDLMNHEVCCHLNDQKNVLFDVAA
jgi:hypothetical protein